MQNVEQLVATGQDATQNYFDIITNPIQGYDFTALNIRTQTFNVPGSGAPTYERKYKSEKILLTTAEIEQEKTLTVNFIIDELYLEYKKVIAWKNAVANVSNGVIGALSTLKTTMTVIAYSSAEIPVQQWVFEGVRVINVGDVSFDRNSGEALAVDITFAFDRMKDEII